MLGVTLFVLAMLEGFCGYSLPDDLISGTGLRIAEGIMLSIPLVGTYVTYFAFGGEYPGHEIIPRLYGFHILLVPGLLLALVGAHLTLVFSLKHTHWAGRGKTNRNVAGMPALPQFVTRTGGLFFAVRCADAARLSRARCRSAGGWRWRRRGRRRL
jgi:ubiquinol-cytochrome c reductase cytochrome b subunit